MVNRYIYGGYMDIGEGKETQEDFINCMELDENTVFCIIADGTGSIKGYPQSAPLVVTEISEEISSWYREENYLLMMKPEAFIRGAMLHANRVLGGFKVGNEDLFSGYSVSVSCLLIRRIEEKSKFYLGHCGNTRIYLLRNGKLLQLSEDHTVGSEMLKEGKIDDELYYALPERLKITSGLGLLWNPKIQTRSGTFKETDLIVMSTDGVHYALRPEGMARLVLESRDCNEAARALIDGAKEFKYPDNMSAIVIRDSRF